MDYASANWERTKQLFQAALELEPSKRPAFLAQNCTDDALRREVGRLLLNYQEAGEFLDVPALNPEAAQQTPVGMVDYPVNQGQANSDFSGTAASAEAYDPLIGQHLGAYKLVRRIGQGGMAAVYLAVRADHEFCKEVAIKIVQPGLDAPNFLNRFRNERQTLAVLDHPNIVKLLDGASTPEGLPFLVMDYVEGFPIDDYCDRYRLHVDERLRLFSKVCAAVEYAHQKGIIHRDLKPANILVTAEGIPKLLDFGIAKVLNPEPSAQIWHATQTGTRCMTPAFASPEQMRAKSVTAASDIYSLGVVLYELLTGHRPYRLMHQTPAEIERAICEQDPEAPSAAVSRIETDTTSTGVPVTKTPELISSTREHPPEKLCRRLRGDLDNIVLKTLQKEPEHRYHSVAEFSQDIDLHLQHLPVKARPSTLTYRASKFARRYRVQMVAPLIFLLLVTVGVVGILALRRPPASPGIHSLAVLPLQNLSGDPEQEFFSEGLTDALITDLAQIGKVKVLSRSTSARYKGSEESLARIAKELGVDGIVEGTVQQSGNRVRVTAQVIEGRTDRLLWANSYERDRQGAFALDRELTEDITNKIFPNPGGAAPPPHVRAVDPKAFELYLQACYHLQRFEIGFGVVEKRQAQRNLEQAIKADPTFSPSYVKLVSAHSLPFPEPEDLQAMLAAARKAVELDPTSADARVALGNALWAAGAWAESQEQFRRGIAFEPNSALAHMSLSNVLLVLGATDDAWKEAKITSQLVADSENLAWVLYARGDYDGAIQSLLRFSESHPHASLPAWNLSENYLQKGMYKEWIQELGTAMARYQVANLSEHLHHALTTAGPKGALLQWAKELQALNERRQLYYPGAIARAYAMLDDRDRAFYWLEDAYKHRDRAYNDPYLWGAIRIDPGFASLRADPRLNELLRRVGLPEVETPPTASAGQHPHPVSINH